MIYRKCLLSLLCTLMPWTVQVRTAPLVTIPPDTLSEGGKLDLAFIMDCTGSMSSYIENARRSIRAIVDDITASSKGDVRLALIEYRDHPPQDRTFVTRKHDFTDSVSSMKSWLNAARAGGGGDGPEAVANALYDTTKLSWRPEATKISVLISDAPPHGLVPSQDSSFPNGSPDGYDPMILVRDLAQLGVTLYVIGCEPSIVPYKDFFMALAYLTGGQYVPLSAPHLLANAITGGAQEELSLQKYKHEVKQEIQKAIQAAKNNMPTPSPGATYAPNAPTAAPIINMQQIAASVYQKLSQSGATSTQLVRNNNTLEGASTSAKLLSTSTSMGAVSKEFKMRPSGGGSSGFSGSSLMGALMPTPSPGFPGRPLMPTAAPGFTAGRPPTPAPSVLFGGLPTAAPGFMTGAPTPSPVFVAGGKPTYSHGFGSAGGAMATLSPGLGFGGSVHSGGGSSTLTGGSETIGTITSGITLEQINRLVQQGISELSTT